MLLICYYFSDKAKQGQKSNLGKLLRPRRDKGLLQKRGRGIVSVKNQAVLDVINLIENHNGIIAAVGIDLGTLHEVMPLLTAQEAQKTVTPATDSDLEKVFDQIKTEMLEKFSNLENSYSAIQGRLDDFSTMLSEFETRLSKIEEVARM
jgi:hypothetical protein